MLDNPMPHKIRKPNLFLVGAPKCGTTSLHNYLSQHPDVYMSPDKEPYYFCTDIKIRYRRHHYANEEAYLQLFAGAGSEKYLGESTTFYLSSERAAHNIKEFTPDAKIICSLRNPVDMMYSMYRFQLKRGEENARSFEEALALEPYRARGERLPRACLFRNTLLYHSLASYESQVRKYYDLFGRDQVYVVLFDDLYRDALQTCRELFKFLEIDVEAPIDIGTKNSTDAVKASWSLWLGHAFPRVMNVSRRIVPARIRRTVMVNADWAFPRRFEPSSSLDRDLRNRLVHEFRPENEKLSRLINRDLSAWIEPAVPQ